MTYAIILAGGSGKRFWPVSREAKPKQFLPVCSTRPMIVDTVERIRGLVDHSSIYVAGSLRQRAELKACLGRRVKPQNFLFEPQGKNTFAPIAYLCQRIHRRDLNAVIIVVPSDHYISNTHALRSSLRRAIAQAQKRFIVTLGIVPTRPETGYGYIEAAAPVTATGRGNFFAVERFIEKPDSIRARQFIKNKKYLWNSGIFVFRADIMLKEIKRLTPYAYGILARMEKAPRFARLWRELPFISLDYAIMEKTDKAVVLPCACGWTDVGSWQALAGLLSADKQGNVLRGHCLDLASKNTFVWAHNRLVATVGLDGMIVIDTPDALLVCPKGKSQQVKDLVGLLERTNLRKLL